MIRSIARIFLYAALLNLHPHNRGARFSELLALGFLVETSLCLLHTITKMFVMGVLGKNLEITTTALMVGYWIVSTVELKMLSNAYPHVICFSGWPSTMAAGAAILVLNCMTRSEFRNRD